MQHKGPHISIPPDYVVNRILKINIDDFAEWPESVRVLAISIAEELFLVAYNPFINPDVVKESVRRSFERESISLAQYYATAISEGITMFWSAYAAEMEFREKLLEELKRILPADCIRTDPMSLIETATDATDLRMELPLLVAEPETSEQIAEITRLANEMKFAIIPRGGGSGMTGGAVPARRRSLILGTGRLCKIGPIDLDNMTVICQAGAITQQVIDYVASAGALFSIDPASRQASTIGGNISENAGGPMAFEYGTTLDNLIWWKMVNPTGEIILIERENHPGHKILPEETATFVVKDPSGGVRNVVKLTGDQIRLPGLGKDVTNKALSGLPGMQKEGVDGIITEACFHIHPQPVHSKVMVLEFYGRSMATAARVVRDLVDLRNNARKTGDYVHLSALEEFNAKYVQAIEYQPKSRDYKALPISVIILQADGDDPYLLDTFVKEIVSVVQNYDNVEIFVAQDRKEAELFWEDRHKLSAIAKRTSGFKLNEDVVIPINRIPDFSLFLEKTNLEQAARAYRHALQEIARLPGIPMENMIYNEQFARATKAACGDISPEEMSDNELMRQAEGYIKDLINTYPHLSRRLHSILDYMLASRIIVASHMHAGDGNCHVNIPVNSNDRQMLEAAEETAASIMKKSQEMGGEVSGEHGIGITKIAFLEQNKMEDLRAFKERVDPRDIMNPAKLVYRDLPVRPFTFSFNQLINDIRESGLPDKKILIDLLSSIQICTRCGKCRLVCAMCYPQKSLQYQPRNKNMALGMLLEAVYYSQLNTGAIDDNLLKELRSLVEHCTACGRCASNCPVKIPSDEVSLSLRALLNHEGASGHPIKDRALSWLSKDVRKRVPKAAKLASVGQKMQNRTLEFLPSFWKKHIANPLFSGPGPKMGYTNLYESLKIHRGNIFTVEDPSEDKSSEKKTLAIYFPGCGGSLFYDRIGLSSVMLLLKAGYAVMIPSQHLCCGFPLLAAGHDEEFKKNGEITIANLESMLARAAEKGFKPKYLVTSCGSCRSGLEKVLPKDRFPDLEQIDVSQLVLKNLTLPASQDEPPEDKILYHAACHAEWTGSHKIKSQKRLTQALTKFSGSDVIVSPNCCGESGMGAVTSPNIYNPLRQRKMTSLEETFNNGYDGPILVGCPSCKIGIGRTLLRMNEKRPVLHIAEWIAGKLDGEDRRQSFRKKVNETRGDIRVIRNL